MIPKTDFAARRDSVANRLAALREERGAAVADGKRFDDGRIAQAEAELQAIDDAQAVIARRGRATDSAAYAEQRRRNVAALLEWDAKRLEAFRQFEAASRAQTRAAREINKICAEERKLFTALKKPQPDLLTNPSDLGWQLLAARMTTWDNAHPSNYGFIKWRSSRFTFETDWVATVTIQNLKEMFS